MRRWGLYLSLGGLAYWVPDILIQWAEPPHYVWINALTFLVPALVVSTWFLLARLQRFHEYRRSLALFMLLGIWLFGPLGIAIGVLASGGTVVRLDDIPHFVTRWAMFPATTYIMSTYSGSLGGVILATFSLCAAAAFGGQLSRASSYHMGRPRER